MAEQKPVKCSSSEEVAQFYDNQYQKHSSTRDQREQPERRPDPAVRTSLGRTPPYMSILLATTLLVSTAGAALASHEGIPEPRAPKRQDTRITLVNTVEQAALENRGSGRRQAFDPGDIGAPKGGTGGSGTR